MKKINRAGKYLIFVSVLLILFNTFLGAVLTRQSANAMRTLINSRMLDIANTAASMLDGDVLERLTKDDKDTPEYKAALEILTYFQDNIELEYIYCIRDMGDKTFTFTIDPTVEDPGEFGDPIVYTDALYAASLGTPAVDDEPYEDKWGRFYSAYSPVFDSDHNVAGIVAVDFSAAWYEHEIARLIWTTVIIIVVAFILSVMVAHMVGARYKRSFTRLYKEMNELSEGIETLVREVSPEAEATEEHLISADEGSDQAADEIAVIGNKVRSMQGTLKTQIDVIRAQAYFDGLTGLKNRTSYEDHIDRVNEAISKRNAAFTVAVFDINQLKTINDELGHDEGDRVIMTVADKLKQIFGSESVYRIGGDEFVAILDADDPKDKMKQLRRELKDTAISMGYAFFVKAADTEYSTVFKRADEAMYADKREYYQTHQDRRKRRPDYE